MRVLLTSAGINNRSIHDALVELLDKPIAESNALFVPTAIYPFPGGMGGAWRAISDNAPSPNRVLGQCGEVGGADSRPDLRDRR